MATLLPPMDVVDRLFWFSANNVKVTVKNTYWLLQFLLETGDPITYDLSLMRKFWKLILGPKVLL